MLGCPKVGMGRRDQLKLCAHGPESRSEAVYWDEVESSLHTRLFDWALHLRHARPLGKPHIHSLKHLVVSVVDGPRDRSQTRHGRRIDAYARHAAPYGC